MARRGGGLQEPGASDLPLEGQGQPERLEEEAGSHAASEKTQLSKLQGE